MEASIDWKAGLKRVLNRFSLYTSPPIIFPHLKLQLALVEETRWVPVLFSSRKLEKQYKGGKDLRVPF